MVSINSTPILCSCLICQLQLSTLIPYHINIHNGWLTYGLVLVFYSHGVFPYQGSIVSSIGYGINSIISAIATVLETIIGAIVAVCTILDESSAPHLNLLSQVIVAIFDVITDILCCRCCGRRRSSRSTRTGRRGFSRRRRGYNNAPYAY